MIDWGRTAAHALWITGAAIVLAALSYHQWRAAEVGRRRWSFLDEPSWQVSWAGGMCLFALGGIAVGGGGWHGLAFGVLALVFAAYGAGRLRRRWRG